MLRTQRPDVLCKKCCSYKFRNIHWETLVLESLFNKSLQASNFIKKRPQQRHFPVNIPKFLTTPILKNICERLLLMLVVKDNLTLTILVSFPRGGRGLLSRTKHPKKKMTLNGICCCYNPYIRFIKVSHAETEKKPLVVTQNIKKII